MKKLVFAVLFAAVLGQAAFAHPMNVLFLGGNDPTNPNDPEQPHLPDPCPPTPFNPVPNH